MMPFDAPIPGETPIEDLSGLKIKGITTRNELNQFEAENISKAVSKYLAGKPSQRTAKFDFPWCLRLHEEMFDEVWEWAGALRTYDLNIGDRHGMIANNLAQLLDDLHAWPNYFSHSEIAVRLHHGAVKVHPFVNGNGRWSRLLANIWLRQNECPLTLWPEAMIGTSSVVRSEYLAAIIEADQGDYEALIELHQRYTSLSPGS